MTLSLIPFFIALGASVAFASFVTPGPTGESPEENQTVVQLRSRFIAGNALEIRWVLVGSIGDEVNTNVGDNISEMQWELSNTSSVYAVIANETCDVPVLPTICHFNQSQVCTFWNLEPTRYYLVCLRSWSANASEEMRNSWRMVNLTTEFRQPPSIVKCTAIIVHGDHKVMEDTAGVLDVPFLELDTISLSCDVTGHPMPSIIWCKNRLDCNASDAEEFRVDSHGVLQIRNASRQHGGLLHCIAENQYGRAMTSAIHLNFMELPRFPSSDDVRTYTVSVGASVRLDCRYPSNSLAHEFTWSKIRNLNDPAPQEVLQNERIVLGWDGSLLFLHTLAPDAGTYQCNVMNRNFEFKKVSGSPSKLELIETSPSFNRQPELLTKSPEIVRAIVGGSLKLQCAFGGKPVPEVVWRSDSSRYELRDENLTLVIDNVQLADQHKYTCSAHNSEGATPESTINVVVHEAPRFVQRPRSRNTTVGQTIRFLCEAAGNPSPQLNWLINGRPIKAQNALSWNYTLSSNSNMLIVRNVSWLTAFCVQCNISNTYGYQLANSYLNVFLPTKITLPPEDVTLTGQAVVIFHCGVESDPSTPVSLTWLRGNKEIVYDLQRIYLLANHSLVLNLTNEEDGGNSFVAQYTCHATNGLDEDSQSAKLRPAFVLPIRRDESTVLPDMLWLGAICGVICLVIISTTTVCLVCNRPHRVKDSSASGPTFQRPDTSWRHQESVKMTRRSKQKPGGAVENRFCLDLLSVENASLHSALQQMYIPRQRLRLGNSIGRGQFGRVFSAYLCHAREKIEEHVAVKTMKYKPEETEMAELFLREAVLMKDFWHVHVLGVIGVTFDPDGSPMVILPFMANGDLRKYIMNTELDITVLQLLKMSLQVAYGMTYLSSMRFVHRDLAARNCMVDERGVVKVADFGLSRELILCDYYRLCHNKTPVPVRWMAPECLEANVFTTMSDVWSFGVLLWELVTRGAVPFSDLENWEVGGYIQSGKRLPQPLYCPDSVYSIMQNCWQEESYHRPTFDQITHDIDQIIRTAQALSSNGGALTSRTPTSPVYSNTRPQRPPVDSDYHE